MMKNPVLNFIVLATSLLAFYCLSTAQEKPPVPVRSWDLNVNTDYAARMAKKVRTITLDSPTIAFIDNKRLALAYADGEGSSPDGTILIPHAKQLGAREMVQSPLYKFHVLIFDADGGPEMANHLEWDAVRKRAQVMPTHDGGFAVRVDNQFMTYSNDLHLRENRGQTGRFLVKIIQTRSPLARGRVSALSGDRLCEAPASVACFPPNS
jgi:hypothetical protein